MQLIMTTLSVIAGMVFSLGISLLVEELIFGKVLCVMFAQRTHQPKTRYAAIKRGNLCGLAKVKLLRRGRWMQPQIGDCIRLMANPDSTQAQGQERALCSI